MAKKNSAKQGKDFFDTTSGRVLADLNFADHRTSANLKSAIAFILEAFPLRSKSDITLVLQSCDYDVEAAFACFTNGEADNHLKEWNTQGKKSKNGNSAKKKRNKKKQVKNGEPDPPKADGTEQKSENDIQLIQNGYEVASIISENDSKEPTAMSSTTLECPSSSSNLLLPPSPSSSEISLPSSNSDVPADAIQNPETSTKHSTDSPTSSHSTPAKFERMMSTGPDALKKTVKDLQRSSVSLPRFQLLLEEECEKSFKSITETFKELRQSLNNRETQLLAQMEELKKKAVELLEQRQENAAALKLKSERVGGMPEAEVTQLRNEIKHFVTERKIDEELAKTTRFVGDKDQLLSAINNFGEVVPVKSCYSPVILNPPPLPTKTVEGNKQDEKTTEPVKPVTSPASTSATVPTITEPTEEKSASSHKTLQEVAELHAKLQEALRQQGLSSSAGTPPGGQRQSRPDNRKGRPNSASQAPPQKQSSTQRPQTAHPQSQQQRKDRNPQHEKPKDSRSTEPKGSQQDSKQGNNQSHRNSRRGNPRRQPPPRSAKSDASNEKKEGPKEEAASSSETSEKIQPQSKSEKEKQSQSDVDRVKLQQAESSNKEYVQAGSRNPRVREQRDGGDERPRNRNRRRGGRREAVERQNERGPSKGSGEKSKNGLLEKDLPEKCPVEKSAFSNEEKKSTVKEEDIKLSVDRGNKDDSSVAKNVEDNNGAAKSQEVVSLSGKETDNSSARLNGEKTHEGDATIKEALPQRPDRASRRRGAQRDGRERPRSKPASNGDLNGMKPVENGVGHNHAEEASHVQIDCQKSKESSQDEKLPVVKKETKINSQTAQEHEEDFDKAQVPKVNGYIPVKELNEVSIGR